MNKNHKIFKVITIVVVVITLFLAGWIMANQLGLVENEVERVQYRVHSWRELRGIGNVVHIEWVTVGMTITHAQMQIDDFHDVGAHAAIEAKLHILDAQCWITHRREERIVLNDIAESQQFTASIQARIKLQFLVQNIKATSHIGSHGKESGRVIVARSTIHEHTEMQSIELIAHLKVRVDLEQHPVDSEGIVLLSHAIIVLEPKVNANLLGMILLAPEILGIAQGIAKIDGMFPIEKIKIIQVGAMA